MQNVAGLSYYIDMEKLLSNQPEKAKAILDDGIKKRLNVIRYCNDTKKVNKAHHALLLLWQLRGGDGAL